MKDLRLCRECKKFPCERVKDVENVQPKKEKSNENENFHSKKANAPNDKRWHKSETG